MSSWTTDTDTRLRATDMKVTGQLLDPAHMGRIIKPRELVDIIELTPHNRSETILYNAFLANVGNNIRTQAVHKILKASLGDMTGPRDHGIHDLASHPDAGELCEHDHPRKHLLTWRAILTAKAWFGNRSSLSQSLRLTLASHPRR